MVIVKRTVFFMITQMTICLAMIVTVREFGSNIDSLLAERLSNSLPFEINFPQLEENEKHLDGT